MVLTGGLMVLTGCPFSRSPMELGGLERDLERDVERDLKRDLERDLMVLLGARCW